MPAALIYSLLLGTVAVLLAVVSVFRAEKLTTPVRLMVAMVLAPLACFCVFGFGAAFEPGEFHIVWRWLYGTTFITCLAALWRLNRARRRDDNA